jgi:hypothetical protein
LAGAGAAAGGGGGGGGRPPPQVVENTPNDVAKIKVLPAANFSGNDLAGPHWVGSLTLPRTGNFSHCTLFSC